MNSLQKKKLIKIRNPKNIEYITKIFFNQRRKMIKKNFIKLFRNFNQFANKINIQLTDRPQKIPVDKFLMIVQEYENNLS